MVCRKSEIIDVSKICSLLALAERDSKNATIFFFLSVRREKGGMLPGVPNGDCGNWGKIRDDTHCMQISLVMSIRFIFGDDWSDTCKLKTFGNDVIFPKSRPLIFV